MADERVIGITGANDFVAQALIADLISTGGPEVRLFGSHAGFMPDGRVVEGLKPAPAQLAGVDTVVHLAALTTSKPPEEILTAVNVRLAADLISSAIEAGVRRLVFFSSMSVHGRTMPGPVPPDALFAPVNAYGRSKATAERVLNHINRDGAIELIVVRPPMIYGPGVEGSFNTLFKLVRSGVPLPFGAACSVRSFCSVPNVVSAIRSALDHPTPPAVLMPADPSDFSTRSLIETMASASHIPARLVPAPAALMKLILGAAGQAEMAASLFEPLAIDRRHWDDWGWSPPVTGRQAAGATVSALMKAGDRPAYP